MNYVDAPNEFEKQGFHRPWVFMAGGITNCPDWQAELWHRLQQRFCAAPADGGIDVEATVLNPRRVYYPVHDPDVAEQQITWEYRALMESDLILFWFAAGSDNPLALYEYGVHTTRLKTRYKPLKKPLKKIVVGCDPLYSRQQDVVIQTRLWLPDLCVHQTFDKFVEHAQNAIMVLAGVRPCPQCGDRHPDHRELLNYSMNWHDGDIHCTICGTFVRRYDAG